jgi:hypothetical protein
MAKAGVTTLAFDMGIYGKKSQAQSSEQPSDESKDLAFHNVFDYIGEGSKNVRQLAA